ncbi:MAG: Rab family GTPase, partial [Candidatus Helarchaeota archaeon]
ALKLLLIGESQVGKTSFIKRLQNKEFLDQEKPTIDVEFHSLTVNFKEKPIKLSIFDFGGKPQFRFMQASQLRGAFGVFLMFDVSNRISFQKLEEWMDFLKPLISNQPNFPIILIGNKIDLNNSLISDREINDFLTKHGIKIYEKISSKIGENIQQPLQKLIFLIMRFYMEKQKKVQEEREKILKETIKKEEKTIEISGEEEIDLITPMRNTISDVANLNLNKFRKDLKDLRKNLRRTFRVFFSPPKKEEKKPKTK